MEGSRRGRETTENPPMLQFIDFPREHVNETLRKVAEAFTQFLFDGAQENPLCPSELTNITHRPIAESREKNRVECYSP